MTMGRKFSGIHENRTGGTEIMKLPNRLGNAVTRKLFKAKYVDKTKIIEE